MDTHDPRDLALGRVAIDSGIVERADASKILALATAQRCGFLEAARRAGLSPSVIDRLARLRPQSSTVAPGHVAQTASGRIRATSSRLSLAKRLAPGATFGGHVIEKTLGQGGMGIVLLGKDASGAAHAIKVPFFDTNSEDRRKRFLREAQALAKLDHPGVLKVHAVGEDDGAPFCVLEVVEGDALDHLLVQGPLEPARALAIAEEVARALAHAHGAGIVHRDVKPSNVMVRREGGRAILMDFGLAADDEAERLTKTGAMLGTPRYMAPEQAAGAGRVDGRADVYSLGATLFELLVGEPVFEADSTIALVAKITSEPAEAPSRKRPGLSSSIDAVVLRSLEKAPDDRYPTALALAEDLARLRRGETVGVRPRLIARRRRMAALALVALVAGGSAAGVAIFQGAKRLKESAREEKRRAASARVRAAADLWRRARFGLEPPPPDAFPDACRAFEEASEGRPPDALAAEVAQARAIVEAERALAKDDRAAARACVERIAEGPERRLLAALALDDPLAARDGVDALAREASDPRLRVEATLALVRLETKLDPPAALRRLAALAPPPDDDARLGEKTLRTLALAAAAEAFAREGSDQVHDTLAQLERASPAAAREASLASVRAALGRVGKDPARVVTARLWKLYERDTSTFAQPGLAPGLLKLVQETFAADEVPLTGKCFEMATRSDPSAPLPRAVIQGLPSAAQSLLSTTQRRMEQVIEIELVLMRIGEHSALLDSFEDSNAILEGLEKRLEKTPGDWTVKLALAGRIEDTARSLRLLDEVAKLPEPTPRSRTLARVLRAHNLKKQNKVDEALAEATAALEAGYAKPDALGCDMADLLRDAGRYEESYAWAKRAFAEADDRVVRSNDGFDALAEGRPSGMPLQPVGAIARSLKTRPRVFAVMALLALGRFDEAWPLLEDARVCGVDKEAPWIHANLMAYAKKLEVQGKASAAAVAREMAAKAKKF